MSALPPAAAPDPYQNQPPPAYHLPPPGPGAPPPPQGGGYVYDPLVPEPDGGLTPLWQRLQDTLRRSGGQLLLIFLVTIALPQITQSAVVNLLVPGVLATPLSPVADLESDERAAFTAGALVVVLVSAVVIAVISAIGWGAGIWTVTQAAAGQPVDLGTAFVAGIRRMGPMVGWYLLYALMVGVGIVACILPGLYLAVAGSLFSFVVVFERGRNPFGRSFSLVHKAFGQVLGRVALLALAALGVSCVVGFCTGAVGAALGEAGIWLGDVVTALLAVPIVTVVLVGLLLTYTQARARQEPVSTAALWAAANHDAGYYHPGNPGYPGPGQGWPGQGQPGQG